MGNNKNPYFNSEGYADPTAFHALKPIIKEESEMDRKVHMLITTLKNLVELSGFEFIGRIQVRHKNSGKEFR